MRHYLDLYRRLHLPDAAVALAGGEYRFEGDEPLNWAGFPPALLPLGGSASGIIRGYWAHWFVPHRRRTIVEFYGQTLFGRPMVATELARNFTQYVYIQLLRQIALFGSISEALKRLAMSVTITDLDRLHELGDDTGDDLTALLDHPAFAHDPPQACFKDTSSYPGDFPRPGMEDKLECLFHACGYEIHSRFGNGLPDPLHYRQRVARLTSAPPWLRASEQAPVFRDRLNADDLAGAWLSLNSPGWRVEEARRAIESLAERAGDADFAMLASAWAALRHEQRVGDTF